jgi:beta-aspartyl-dipeptidase (metallo-type)
VEVVDGRGLVALPGLIDNHVHIAGGGGEGGPATRTGELRLDQLLAGGITTVIGVLGTDGFTRSLEGLLMKAKSLRGEGVSCWIYTGSYQVPPPTLLGDVARDLALIEEVIGVGEIAVADHRSSGPTVDELIRIASHARVGGMLGGKAGIVNLHMGDAEQPFAIIYEVVRRSELKLTQFLPTHCNRNASIFEDAKSYGFDGYVDITASSSASSYPHLPDGEVKASTAIAQLIGAGVPISHITMSSDGCGSLPSFDAAGQLVKLDVGQPASIFHEFVDTVEYEGLPLDQAVRVVSTNVANILRLPRKGRIVAGGDADLTFIDRQFQLHHVLAKGRWMVRDGEPVRRPGLEEPA